MLALADTKEIFEQLADTDGSMGVVTLIETHDAWVNNAAVISQISLAMRAQLARTHRSDPLMRRIERQRKALAAMVVMVPGRVGAVG